MSTFEARWHTFHSAPVWFSTALLARTLDRFSMQVVVCHKKAKRSRAKPGRSRTNKSQPNTHQNIHAPKRSRAKPGRSRGVHPGFSTWISQIQCSAPPPIYITNKDWGGAGKPSEGSRRNDPSTALEGDPVALPTDCCIRLLSSLAPCVVFDCSPRSRPSTE